MAKERRPASRTSKKRATSVKEKASSKKALRKKASGPQASGRARTTTRALDRSDGGAASLGGAKREWSLRVPAHTSTWAFLGRYERLKASFPDSPGVKLKTLAYWSAAPGATNDTAANDLALRLVDHFARRMFVPYEAGQNAATARQALFAIARKGDETVRALAHTVDDVFDFHGEAA